MNVYGRWRSSIMWALKWFLVLVFAVLITVSFAQVIWRYVFNNSLSWSEELARYLFVWIVFVGAAVGYDRGSHMGLDMLTNRLSPELQRWLKVVVALAILAFAFYLAKFGFDLVLLTLHDPSPVLQVPMAYIYLAIPVGALLTAWIAVERVMEGVRGQ